MAAGPRSNVPTSSGKPSQKEKVAVIAAKWGTNSIIMAIILE
jgi:hypothetical protein